MNFTSRDLKSFTKRYLKKNTPQTLSISSIFITASLMFQFLAEYFITSSANLQKLVINISILLILGLFLSVLSVGYLNYFLHLVKGEKTSYGDLFFGFKTCPDKIIGATTLMYAISLVWLVPSGIGLTFYYLTGGKQELYVVLFILLLLVGLCFSCYFFLTYSQTLFLIAEHPTITIKNALLSSKKIMMGQKGGLLYLCFSFLGLFLLGILALYLGLFLVFPYFYLTLTFFYLNATQQLTSKGEVASTVDVTTK